MDLISVILSVRNDEKRIESSIDSILKQTYKNFEFLILDDCSSDKTPNIIENYSKIDKRIKFFRNDKHLGLTKSLNKLIELSEGNLIARQDSDDLSMKNRLEKQFTILKKLDLDAVSSRALVVNTNRIIPRFGYYLPLRFVIKFKNPFIHGSLLFKKEALKQVNFYDENFYYAQDYKIMKDLLAIGAKVKILKEPLYKLNIGNNISTKFKDEQKYFADCVKKGITPEV